MKFLLRVGAAALLITSLTACTTEPSATTHRDALTIQSELLSSLKSQASSNWTLDAAPGDWAVSSATSWQQLLPSALGVLSEVNPQGICAIATYKNLQSLINDVNLATAFPTMPGIPSLYKGLWVDFHFDHATSPCAIAAKNLLKFQTGDYLKGNHKGSWSPTAKNIGQCISLGSGCLQALNLNLPNFARTQANVDDTRMRLLIEQGICDSSPVDQQLPTLWESACSIAPALGHGAIGYQHDSKSIFYAAASTSNFTHFFVVGDGWLVRSTEPNDHDLMVKVAKVLGGTLADKPATK